MNVRGRCPVHGQFKIKVSQKRKRQMKIKKINACYCQIFGFDRWKRDGLSASPAGVLDLFVKFVRMKAKFFIDDETTQQAERRRLWKDIKSNKVETFIVPSMDHLLSFGSRCASELMNLLKFFDAHEVTFISLKESLNSATPLGRFNALLFHASLLPDKKGNAIPCIKNRMGNNRDLFPPPPGWSLN